MNPLVAGLFNLAKEWFSQRKIKDISEADLKALALKFEGEMLKGQLALNVQEAKHKSLFVAGWRPAVGWLGVAALSMNYLVIPGAELWLYMQTFQVHDIPQMDTGPLSMIVSAMLGIGGYRTIEKYTGKVPS